MSQDPFRMFADLAAEVKVPDDGITSRTVHQDDHLKVVLFGFSPGQELSEHTAAVPAIMHFLKGEARVVLGERESDAAAGTWVHMDANLPHSIVAKTPVSMLLLLLKSAKAPAASGSAAGTGAVAGGQG